MSHRNGNAATSTGFDTSDIEAATDTPPVVEDDGIGPASIVDDRSPTSRPVDPEVDRLIAAGARAREWRGEARGRLHQLMRRLVKMGGTEADAVAVLEGEQEHWRGKAERRKTRERAGVGAKP